MNPTQDPERRLLLREVAKAKREEHATALVANYGWQRADAESCALRTYSNRWIATFSTAALARMIKP